MMPTGDEQAFERNRTDRYEVVRQMAPKPKRELFVIWDRQKNIYVDSSTDESAILALRDLLNERDRKDWDYGARA